MSRISKQSYIQIACATAGLSLILGCGAGGLLTASAPNSQTVPLPSFSPAAGSYTGVQTITLADSATAAAIYYTVDGSAPSASSPVYTAPISLKANATIKALASAPGYTSSNIVSADYVISAVQTALPIFSPIAGNYAGPQVVTLTDLTPGAIIYYTTDGSVPSAASSVYAGPIAITATETLSAIAVAAKYGNSVAATGIYTINAPLATSPTFSPGPGTYTSAQTVTIADTSVGATIYYTTDGTAPSTHSAVYTKPISIASTEILSAIAGGALYSSSSVTSASYTIALPQASAPLFSPAPGPYTSAQAVTLADTLPSATIYYTTDGSKPTTASQVYKSPLSVSSSEIITAVAFASGYALSAPARGSYSIGASGSNATYTFNNVQIVGGGFVDGIVMHPAQQGLMYARTDVGGAYRWDNMVKQWIPLLDFLSRDLGNYMGVESIGMDPADPSKLFLAVGTYADSFGTNGAMMVSGDQGQTFTTVPLPFKLGSNDAGRFAGERLSVDPNLGSHIYFGSRLNGLWESKDTGSTWSQVSSFPVTGSVNPDPSSTGGVIFEDFVKSSGSGGSLTPVVYAGVDDSTVSALYISTDAGKSWAAVSGQPTGMFLNRGVLGNDSNLYLSYSNNLGPAGATQGSIWRYTLPTQFTPIGTWKDITPIPSFNFNSHSIGYGSVTIDPERPGVIMATTLDLYYLHDDIFRSLDGGNSWFDLGANQARDSSLSPWLNFGQSSAPIGNWLVSIVIDPYDSNHVLYGTGQTIWETANATAADATSTSPGTTAAGVSPTSWKVGANGLEETVVLDLISPPAGASVLSAVRDIGGFTHTDLHSSPAQGMQKTPIFTDTTSLDFAQNAPGIIVRVGMGSITQQYGAYSGDGGNSWTPFHSQAGSLAGGGSIAVSSNGATFVWAPSDTAVAYSSDGGTTWNPSFGAPSKLKVIADRVNPKKFYMYSPTAGILYDTLDGGANFAPLASNLPLKSVLRASFAAEGDLWLATPTGLLHSRDSGVTFSAVANTQEAYDVSFGKAAPNAGYPAIYMYGRLSGVQGIFRSVDSAATWVTVTDPTHQYGDINVIAADPKVFGRIYLGTSGRGVIYGDSLP